MFTRHISKIKFSLLSLALLIFAGASGQSIKVLPGNGKFSPSSAPQGAVKAQRQFYLIDSSELAKTGLTNNTLLNSIGFTLATAQDTSTLGKFKVYLQNTSDTVSRKDTGWTTVSVTGNNFSLASLYPGKYEWQVRSVCTTSSLFSPSSLFEINSDTCKSPTRLVTSNITATAADLQWTNPATPVDSFRIEYTRIDSVAWTTVYTTNSSLHITGLIAGQSYRWRVASSCSSGDPKETSIFTTVPQSTCPTATGLLVGTLLDSSATVSWSAVAGSFHYELRYRRQGSSTWDYESSVDTTATLLRLIPGTRYEWQVRSVCSATQQGSYADGVSFITTGTQRCYFPENLYTDSLAASSAKLSWSTVTDAASYEVRYRKLETISWASAIAPMTIVHQDSIKTRDTIGAFHVQFKGGSAFTYTGQGLYVAFEYQNDSTQLSLPSVALVNYSAESFKNQNGDDSARMFLSYGASSLDSLAPVLGALSYRPETWLGSSALSDSAAVLAVYAMGEHAVPYGNPTSASALIRNYADTSKTYVVTLTVKDVLNNVKHTENVNATVQKDSLLLVNFASWSSSVDGVDSVIVSIPTQTGENVIDNNRNFYLQHVNRSILAYADNSDPALFTGTDTAKGLTLAKYKMMNCGSVNAVQVYLGPTAVGHEVYAVLVNDTGAIVASSAVLIPDSTNVNRYQSFYFPTAVSVSNGSDFYIGLAQKESSTGYSPVGVQWESGYTREGAYYRAQLNGSGLTDTLPAGRLMIRAEIIPGTLSPTITGNLVLCPAGTTTLSAASISRRFANQVVGVSSEGNNNQFVAAQALGAPNVYPTYGFNQNAWMGATGQREYLELKFPNPDSINYVDIYETFNPGAVDTVYVKNPATGLFESVYTGAAEATDSIAKIKRVSFTLTNFKVDEIRIALTGVRSNGNNAIDAVSIGRLSENTSFSTYAWTRASQSGPVSLGSNSSVSANTAGAYTLTVTNGDGCTASYTSTVSTPDRTAPVITAMRALTFCIGDSITLYSSKTGGNTWSTGATTNQIVVKSSGTYSLTYDDGKGCGSLASNSMVVTVNDYPVVNITGTLGICPGGNTTLTAATTGPSTYSYLWSSGSILTTNAVSNAGPVSVTATDNAGCATTATALTFMAAKPQPDITGALNFCPGGSTSLNAGAGFSSYVWSTGLTSTAVQPVNTIGKYYVTVTNAFGCTGADTVTVGQFTPPTPHITGNRSICGGPTTLNAGGGYVGYLWSGGETTQTILVSQAGTVTVQVIDYNGCTGSASTSTIKDSLPPRPGPITGSGSGICNSPGTAYSISSIPEATHYVWFLPDGATLVSGQGSTNVVIAFGPTFQSGELVVAASNACGQSGSLLPRVFPINVKPATPAEIIGVVSGVCSGVQTYSIAAVDGATSYTWQVPTGATITSGANTTSITVSFASTFVAGNICVKANNSCGSSDQKCKSVTGIPNTPLSITGPSSVCFKQGSVVYSTSLVQGATSYTWTVPPQSTIISGQGTSSIRVNFGTQSGNVTVKTNNTCGSSVVKSMSVAVTNCSYVRSGDASGDVDIAIAQQLEREVIASAGDVNKTTTMQLDWTLGEPCIETMSSVKRMYTQGFHQPIAVVSKQPVVNDLKLKIFAAPNPVATTLKVSFEAEKSESVILSVRDAIGKMVFVRTVLTTDKGIEINMSSFSQGLYILNVHNQKGVLLQNFKIVKGN